MRNLPSYNGDIQAWAEQLSDALRKQDTLLQVDTTTAPAVVDGVLVLDPGIAGIYVSWNNAWVQVVALPL